MRAAFLIAPVLLVALAGCVPSTTGTTQGNVVSQAQTLNGTIVSVRYVTVNNNTDRIAGGVAGAVVGGLVGNQIGGGSGRDIATAVGVLGGAAAGSQLAAGANATTSPEWTVRLEDGRTVSVVQNTNFQIGQRVRVVVQGNNVRLEG